MADTATVETHGFEAEVSRLLHLMVHSVYSEREIFLRELISNAADACDKLRYEAITTPDLASGDGTYKVTLTVDADARTLYVADNGIGMDHDDLVSNLGTIARSGTAQFVEAMDAAGDKKDGDDKDGDDKDGAKPDMSLIGQFGIGFYSSFMVADKVEVLSRRAGDETAWKWTSDGLGKYTIEPAEKTDRGTTVILHLKEDAVEYADPMRLRHIVKTYSDHIAIPIELTAPASDADEGEEEEEKGPETLNAASALWTRPKSEVTTESYAEFFHHVGGFGSPELTLHYKAEGRIEYSVLLFVPDMKPVDLFDPARKTRVKLYVKRVFISEDPENLLPGYLRFMRGVIDSEDLPLNISREMLQNNPVMTKIRTSVTKRVLSELEKCAEKTPETFEKIWENFGAVIKEGIYEDMERRDQILALARFRSTGTEGLTTLKDYVSRMKDKQSTIYFVTGSDAKAVARSPQIEGFKAKGIEVLLLSDPVDDFWLTAVTDFEGKPLQSVTKGSADLDAVADADDKDADDKKDAAPEGDMTTLTVALKDALGDTVQDVKSSNRLTSSACCLVAGEDDMDMHLARILATSNPGAVAGPRVLEINPTHPLIKAMAARATKDGATDALMDAAHLLLDQAHILEGETLADPQAFAARMAAVMEKGLG